MFDTNIFSAIVDGEVSLSVVKGVHQYLVTHIQRDELEATRNEEKRKELLRIFEVIDQAVIPTESAIWDVSKWDLSNWSEEDGMYERIFQRLERKKPHDRGNEKDALLGETAIKKDITLVSNDRALRETVKELGGVAICLCDFLKETQCKG
jgi:predicted nucleic acid-binding protein